MTQQDIKDIWTNDVEKLPCYKFLIDKTMFDINSFNSLNSIMMQHDWQHIISNQIDDQLNYYSYGRLDQLSILSDSWPYVVNKIAVPKEDVSFEDAYYNRIKDSLNELSLLDKMFMQYNLNKCDVELQQKINSLTKQIAHLQSIYMRCTMKANVINRIREDTSLTIQDKKDIFSDTQQLLNLIEYNHLNVLLQKENKRFIKCTYSFWTEMLSQKNCSKSILYAIVDVITFCYEQKMYEEISQILSQDNLQKIWNIVYKDYKKAQDKISWFNHSIRASDLYSLFNHNKWLNKQLYDVYSACIALQDLKNESSTNTK